MKIQKLIMDKVPDKLWIIMFRRAMIRLSCMLAKELNAKALITGENMIDNIKTQLKDAMISKDRDRIIALRNFLAKLKTKEIEKKESLSKSESLKVLQSMAKQLKDSIDQYTNGDSRFCDGEKAGPCIIRRYQTS